ncbi:unnamed protein product, partial [marine sediment metagenome]
PTFVSVHYPRFSNEPSPTISNINIQGGIGRKINGDYIAYKTGSKITISDSSIETDAEIMFVSSNYFFVKDATYMEIDGTSYGVGSGTGVFLRDCFDTCNSLGYECGYVCGEFCGECGFADLKPTEITYYSWTEPITAGMWIAFESGIENTGTQNAENRFNIKWFLDDEEVRYGSHSPVPAGQTVMDDNSAYVWDVAMPGTHTIKYVVNADLKHVDESNYYNNEVELQFEIPENCKYFVTDDCDEYIDLKAGEITHSSGQVGVPMTFSS